MTTRCEIRIKGCLDPSWSEWFDGLIITPSGEQETLICGTVVDQAALYGIINRLRDLNLVLLSVHIIPEEP